MDTDDELHNDLLDSAFIGAAHMARGLTDFASWSKAMLALEFSEEVRRFLPVIFHDSKKILDHTQNIFDAAEERRQKRAAQGNEDST